MRTMQLILVSGLFAGLICGASGCSRSRWLSRKEYSEIQDPFTDSEEGITPSRFADSGDAPDDAAGGELADASSEDSRPSSGQLDGPKPIRQASGKTPESGGSSISHASYPDSPTDVSASAYPDTSETTAAPETENFSDAPVRNSASAESEEFSEWAADQPAAADSVQAVMEEEHAESPTEEAAGAFAEADSDTTRQEPSAANFQQDFQSDSDDFSSMTAASAFENPGDDAHASELADEQSKGEVKENPFADQSDSTFADSSQQRASRKNDSHRVDAEEADWNSELENMSKEFAEPLINQASAASEDATATAESVSSSGRFREKAAATKSMPAANPFRQQKRPEPQEPEWESAPAPEAATTTDENSDPFSSAARRQSSRNSGTTRRSSAVVNDVSPFSPDSAWKSSSTMK